MTYDWQYLEVLKRILSEGVDMEDRTGVGVRKVFDVNINVDLRYEQSRNVLSQKTYVLPALTLRKVFPRVAFEELLWMLRGSTDVRELQAKDIHIWDGNSSREFLDSRGLYHLREGFIGDGYGKQFRNFNGVDQLYELLKGLQTNPTSRRHFISLWNPAELSSTALPPCHVSYNFVVTGDYLNLKFYQRSSDFILAGSQNFMFAAFFLSIIADMTGFKVGSLAHSIGDCHIYKNHLRVATELLSRDPVDEVTTFTMGNWSLDREWTVNELDRTLGYIGSGKYSGFCIDGNYNPHPAIPKEQLVMAT